MRLRPVGIALAIGASGFAIPSHASTLSSPRTDGPSRASRICPAGSLRGQVGLQGAAGQRGGEMALANRGSTPCDLAGIPSITIVNRKGHPLPVHQRSGAVAQYGAATDAIELVPGQEAAVPLQWSNYCGPNPRQPHLVVRIPGSGTLAVYGGNFFGLGLSVPPCLGRGQPSTLSVGRFQPPEGDPAIGVLTYYGYVNSHMFRSAYAMLEGSKPAFRPFKGGYSQTRHATINLLATPLYRIQRPTAAYTCVGVHFTATMTNGRQASFGGWYLAAVRQVVNFTLVPSRSSIHPNEPLVLPTRAACAARVP